MIKKAYEFALRFIGQDREAGEIWKDYIEYIKADPATNERESQEKMDQLRSVYRRAVQIPLDNLEQLWREWDAFENGLNKLTVGINLELPGISFCTGLVFYIVNISFFFNTLELCIANDRPILQAVPMLEPHFCDPERARANFPYIFRIHTCTGECRLILSSIRIVCQLQS